MEPKYTFDNVVQWDDLLNNTSQVWVERIQLNSNSLYSAIQGFVLFHMQSALRQGVEEYLEYSVCDRWTIEEYQKKFGKTRENNLYEDEKVIFSFGENTIK